jgi:hypothetical protein
MYAPVIVDKNYCVAQSRVEAKGSKEEQSLKEGDIKINVDAAFNLSTGAATVGVVARDHLGYAVMVASLPIDTCNSAEEVEARAILTVLKLGMDHELKVTKVELDCATAVKNTNCAEPITSSIWSVYRDVNYARSLLSRCEVAQIGRKRNEDAHGLAKLAAHSGEASVWLPPIPVAVIELCNQNIVSDIVNI